MKVLLQQEKIKISDLIDCLNVAIQEYGDIPIASFMNHCGNHWSTSVKFEKGFESEEKANLEGYYDDDSIVHHNHILIE